MLLLLLGFLIRLRKKASAITHQPKTNVALSPVTEPQKG
jgi:hypothetical protein